MNTDHVLHDRPLQCRVIPVTRVLQNCSLLWCVDTGRAVVVDPGGEIERLLRAIDQERVDVERLLITHPHPDHSGAAAGLADRLKVPIEGPHRRDEALLQGMCKLGRDLGFFECSPFEPDRWLEDRDEIVVGHQTLLALHCPGHTAGHMAYFSPEARIAFVGDILFRDRVGATAGPFEHLELLRSIRRKLFPLGDDVLFVPGHDRLSTFGDERRDNHAVSDRAAERYNHLFDDPRLRGTAGQAP